MDELEIMIDETDDLIDFLEKIDVDQYLKEVL